MDERFADDRIQLRPFEQVDAEALRDYLNQPALCGCRYLPWGMSEDQPLSSAQAHQVVSRWAEQEQGLRLAVWRHHADRPLGHLSLDWGWDSLSATIVVVIDPRQARQGYGSAALLLGLRYLFEFTPAHTAQSWFASWNAPARAFCLRHGFTEMGGQRRAGMRGGRPFDEVWVDLLRREWSARGA